MGCGIGERVAGSDAVLDVKRRGLAGIPHRLVGGVAMGNAAGQGGGLHWPGALIWQWSAAWINAPSCRCQRALNQLLFAVAVLKLQRCSPGGLGHFVLGFIMTCIGGYLLINQVTVVGSYWNFWGGNSFGITLLPMLFGIGLLFWRGRSILGWILTIAGALFIFAGVLANLHIFFQPTSLFNTIVILVLLVGGLGFIARGVQPHNKQAGE